ncbi:MAG: PEP-CTERM sorting domain-containing protein [Burkholderiales bacterium]
MNTRVFLTAVSLALLSSQAVATPVFVDGFSETPATVLSAAPGGTFSQDTLLLTGSLIRKITLQNDAGSGDDLVAKGNYSSSGLLSVSKPAGVTGTIDINYSGSALSALTTFTGTVGFGLRSLDLAGMDVRLIVGGTERASVLDLPVQSFAAVPLAVSMTWAGNWSNGFTLRFEPLEDSDFRVDNLALVPAPGTLALLGLGLLAVVGARRKFTK